ncbi:MAG TPA: hypothetical protein VK151_16410 [Fluviicola sp.]|nr:hypothetical protein [Fluviicola sp.]
MITSRTKNENYLAYLFFEILMVGVITFIGTALIVFYSTGRSDTRHDTRKLDYLFDNPFVFGIICLIPALIAVAFLLYFRNRNYIVGYRFDHQNKLLMLEYRGLRKKSLSTIEVGFDHFSIKPFTERKIFANQPLKGTSIMVADKNLQLDFVTNNFIWEKQPRERVAFLEELGGME